ncbi:hypothetical protein SAMD00019534_038060, partial [Acytostelium subglobosum LB1]|uniref:hypothetical protein n=1 Tax=Acytostelium subglobosum LB1 TaxID=1410327 RepID=UPI000644A3C3
RNKKYDNVLAGTAENPLWFEGGQLNISYNALDRHVNNNEGNRMALIHETPMFNKTTTYTYSELHEQVCLAAAALANLGVVSGDRVVIYMPTIPQAVMAMLACARLGATHSVVFGGFAAPQLASRIEHCKPKVVICSDFGVEGKKIIPYTPLLREALASIKYKPEHVIVYERKDVTPGNMVIPNINGALDWSSLMRSAQPMKDHTVVDSSHPLYILYTSGTTGNPKGIVRSTGGYAVALAHVMGACYDCGPGDTFFATSDVGWVVAHTLSVYGPLIRGMTSVIYEGKPILPDSGVFWRMVQDHNIKSMFTAPTAARAIQREDPDGKMAAKYDLSSLKSIWMGGERGDPTTLKYIANATKAPVYDNYWQTESGWAMISNCRGAIPVRYGAAGMPVLGSDFHVIDPATGKRMSDGNMGEVLAPLPLPPGYCTELYNNKEGYKKAYLTIPGFYRTGDAGYEDRDGYIHIMTRVDDIINTSGHRISTASIEEVLYTNPNIVECAVVGANDSVKGEMPFAFVVLKPGLAFNEALEKEIMQMVRQKVGAFASLKHALAVDRLPKTRSGKIVRNILKAISNDHEHYSVPPTIEDDAVPKEIEAQYKKFKASLDR